MTAGQVLGSLEPRLGVGIDRATLLSDVAEAKVAVEAAQADLARAERLVAEKAVPGRRVEEARRALAIAEARRHAADARLAPGQFPGPYLLGEQFSAVDVLYGTTFAMFAKSPMLPKSTLLDDYAQRVVARPAFARAQGLDGAS